MIGSPSYADVGSAVLETSISRRATSPVISTRKLAPESTANPSPRTTDSAARNTTSAGASTRKSPLTVIEVHASKV